MESNGTHALLGALILIESQDPERGMRLTVECQRPGHASPKEYLVVPRRQGGGNYFDIYLVPMDREHAMRLMSTPDSRLRITKATKTVKMAQSVVNFVTSYGRWYPTRVAIGSDREDEDNWYLAHFLEFEKRRKHPNIKHAGATAIQAAWRGTMARRNVARRRLHIELAMLPPMPGGFPGGHAYHAAAAKFRSKAATMSNNSNKKRVSSPPRK